MSEQELRAELAQQRQEILRLRDLLIVKDAELGAAKGRLAEIDERSQHLAGMGGRVAKRLPGLGRLLGAAARVMRGQQG
jgi:hypothetical protein